MAGIVVSVMASNSVRSWNIVDNDIDVNQSRALCIFQLKQTQEPSYNTLRSLHKAFSAEEMTYTSCIPF